MFDKLFPNVPKAPKGTVYTYADGAANVYYVTPSLIEYSPMTPERSSSGFYSGGDPASAAITSEQFQELKALFEEAIKNTEDQIENRVKGSGNLRYKLWPKSYNFAYESPTQQRIETHLKALLYK